MHQADKNQQEHNEAQRRASSADACKASGAKRDQAATDDVPPHHVHDDSDDFRVIFPQGVSATKGRLARIQS